MEFESALFIYTGNENNSLVGWYYSKVKCNARLYISTVQPLSLQGRNGQRSRTIWMLGVFVIDKYTDNKYIYMISNDMG